MATEICACDWHLTPAIISHPCYQWARSLMIVNEIDHSYSQCSVSKNSDRISLLKYKSPPQYLKIGAHPRRPKMPQGFASRNEVCGDNLVSGVSTHACITAAHAVLIFPPEARCTNFVPGARPSQPRLASALAAPASARRSFGCPV